MNIETIYLLDDLNTDTQNREIKPMTERMEAIEIELSIVMNSLDKCHDVRFPLPERLNDFELAYVETLLNM